MQVKYSRIHSTCMHVLCICSKHGNERNSWKHTYFGSNRLDPRGTEPKPRTEPEQRHATQSGSRFLGHPFFGSRFSRFQFGSVRFRNHAHLYIPIWWTNSTNIAWGKALVNKSGNWYSVPTKHNSIVPFSTCSLMKWYLRAICFDF